MGVKPYLRQKIFSKPKGFTLLELIVVMAGLGILSSLAIPNFLALLDQNKVDEIKALLNSAAADCLQKSRSENDPLLDDEIISDGIIEKIGYKIDRKNSILDSDGTPKCSVLWLEPTFGDKNERVRYNIGFSLSNGILDKLASTEVAEKKPDCIKWAGKCKFSKAAKILEEYKEKIREAKAACDLKFTNWKDKNKMNPSKFQQWNSSKGPDTCPKSPPDDESDTSYQNTSTCTTQGCDRDVWGLWDKDKNKGKIYYSEINYKDARDELVGEKCAKQIKDEYENANPPFTNPSSQGVQPSKCTQDYWFIDGEITGPAPNGSEEKWKEAMCIKKTKAKEDENWTDEQAPSPIEHCLLDDGSPKQFYFCNGKDLKDKSLHEQCLRNKDIAECEDDIDKKRNSGKNGPYTNPTQGPPPCGKKVWFCNKNQYTEIEYQDTSCGANKNSCSSFTDGNRAACAIPRNYPHPICVALRSCKP